MKRLLGVLIVTVVVVSAACGSTSSNGSADAPGGGGSVAGAAGSTTAVKAKAVVVGSAEDPMNQDPVRPGAQRLHFETEPIEVKPGQNNITTTGADVPKPPSSGWITRISPNLRRADGTAPPVDVIHLHHGVWLNLARKDPTAPYLPERFFASGEEKTITNMPDGYGYWFDQGDPWLINYMIHNLFPTTEPIWITYDIDFMPATAPEAAGMRKVRPIWMDVQNGSVYPVFDVQHGSGTDGTFTYPEQDPQTYANRPAPSSGGGRKRGAPTTTEPAPETGAGGAAVAPPTSSDAPTSTAPAGGGTGPTSCGVGADPRCPNTWTVDADGVLVGAGLHLHPGGLYGDLFLQRPGATASPGSDAATEVRGDEARLYRSEFKYWEPAGAVSWDVAATVTPPEWKVAVRKGDRLRINATYDSSRASWYESMGIMVLWMAEGDGGDDPFATKVLRPGAITHGHLPENDNHGGEAAAGIPDATKLPSGAPASAIPIKDFIYEKGDTSELGVTDIPTVAQGATITFDNSYDAPKENGIWHTVTACKAPCNGATGVAFPLADGDVQFDSGQLGNAGPPTAGRMTWSTPTNLDPGTYTYFCRVHPFMRGAFRVTPSS